MAKSLFPLWPFSWTLELKFARRSKLCHNVRTDTLSDYCDTMFFLTGLLVEWYQLLTGIYIWKRLHVSSQCSVCSRTAKQQRNALMCIPSSSTWHRPMPCNYYLSIQTLFVEMELKTDICICDFFLFCGKNVWFLCVSFSQHPAINIVLVTIHGPFLRDCCCIWPQSPGKWPSSGWLFWRTSSWNIKPILLVSIENTWE